MPAQMSGHVTTSNAFAVPCSHGSPWQNSRQFGMKCKAQIKQAHTQAKATKQCTVCGLGQGKGE